MHVKLILFYNYLETSGDIKLKFGRLKNIIYRYHNNGMNKSNGSIINYQPLIDNNFEQEPSTPILTTSSAKYLKSSNTTNDFSDTSINNESVKINFTLK